MHRQRDTSCSSSSRKQASGRRQTCGLDRSTMLATGAHSVYRRSKHAEKNPLACSWEYHGASRICFRVASNALSLAHSSSSRHGVRSARRSYHHVTYRLFLLVIGDIKFKQHSSDRLIFLDEAQNSHRSNCACRSPPSVCFRILRAGTWRNSCLLPHKNYNFRCSLWRC